MKKLIHGLFESGLIFHQGGDIPKHDSRFRVVRDCANEFLQVHRVVYSRSSVQDASGDRIQLGHPFRISCAGFRDDGSFESVVVA